MSLGQLSSPTPSMERLVKDIQIQIDNLIVTRNNFINLREELISYPPDTPSKQEETAPGIINELVYIKERLFSLEKSYTDIFKSYQSLITETTTDVVAPQYQKI